MITRVFIDNYRCFSGFELTPGRINLLVGRNGTGKSSLFDALVGIVDIMTSGAPLSQIFAPEELTQWDRRRTQRFELEASLGPSSFTYALELHHDEDERHPPLVSERISRDGCPLFAYHDGEVHLHDDDGTELTRFPFRGWRSFLPDLEAGADNGDLVRFLAYLRRTIGLKLSPPDIESVTTEESTILDKDGTNFASWYRHIAQEHAGRLHELFDGLREAIPGFRSLALTAAGRRSRTRELVAKLEAPGGLAYELELDALSDGQRALVVLYTLLFALKDAPRLVLLDEPENYVGLTEIQPWLASLDDALGDEGQLMLISHHPEVVDFLAAEHPLSFEREHGGPVRARTDVFDRDTGLRASEQLVRGLEHDEA